MRKKSGPIYLFIIIVIATCYSAFFTVDQTERAIVLQLGQPVSKALKPGFHVKIPFLQRAVFIKSCLLDYDLAAMEMLTLDKKKLTIDSYLKWNVLDHWKYYKTVGESGTAQNLLRDIVQGEMKTEVGRFSLMEAISTQKKTIMENVTKRTAAIAKKMGMGVLDVRIKSMVLSADNKKAVFARMISERQRLAKLLLAQGREEARVIQARAEQKSRAVLADAGLKSQEIKGDADAAAARIYAQGLQKAPEFYSFIRNLELYRRSIDRRSTLFFSRDDEVMRLFKGD